MTFPVHIHNQQGCALYDTGAGCSLTNYSMYETLGIDLDKGYKPIVKSSTRENMAALGHVTYTFKIDDTPFTQSFIVCRHMTRHMILGTNFTAMNLMGVIWTRERTGKLMRSNGQTIMELPDSTARVPLALAYSVKIESRGQRTVPLECTRKLMDQMDIRIDSGFHHRNPNVHISPSCVENPGNAFDPKYIPITIFNLSCVDHLYIGRDTVVAFADEPTVDVYNVELASEDKIKEHLAQPRNWVPQHHETLPEIPSNTAFICSPADVPGHRKAHLQGKEELCKEYGQAFSKHKMDIDTRDSPPVSSRPYILPLKLYERVQREIESLEWAGVITKSMSKWASPIVIVPKKSDPGEPLKRRLCIDFRKVNALQQEVLTDRKTRGQISIHPLPKIDEMYAKLKGANVFSTIDLRSGYYHIALGKDSRAKTAFVTTFSKYEFLMVPFGLAQAPAYFQLLMNQVLEGLSFAMTYLDDIIIFSNSEEVHLLHLEEGFCWLMKAGLKMKRSKCDFFKSYIHYMGHLISEDGICPLPDKLDSKKNMLAPKCTKEIK